MEKKVDKLHNLGRKIASAQDQYLEQSELLVNDLDRVKQRLFTPDAFSSVKTDNRSGWFVFKNLAVAGGIAAVITALSLFIWTTGSKTVSQDKQQNFTGQWFSVKADELKTLKFADSSTVIIKNSSTARILEQKGHHVRFLLERGHASINVKHHDDTHWIVDVGPYKVNVIGTSFDVLWEPEEQHFELNLHHGKVKVVGPMIESGHTISSKEILGAWVSDNRVEITAAPGTKQKKRTVTNNLISQNPHGHLSSNNNAKHNDTVSESSVMQNSASLKNKNHHGKNLKEPEAAAKIEVSWSAQNRNGNFASVVSEARQIGLANIFKTSSATDIQALADAARLSGNLDISLDAFHALRQRFPQTSFASNAAYSLGKIAFDKGASYGLAAKWLNTYLAEKPSGALAREARGRLIEAKNKLGDINGARNTARQYLKMYPDGPHAKLAKSILGW
jgi:TolA-binding protein